MKNWMVLILIVLLIFTAGAAGYFLHQPKQVYNTDVIIKPDFTLIQKIDSFEVITKVHLYFIDSLKHELAKTKIKHEKSIANIDTMPAPELFRKIAEYYNK